MDRFGKKMNNVEYLIPHKQFAITHYQRANFSLPCFLIIIENIK